MGKLFFLKTKINGVTKTIGVEPKDLKKITKKRVMPWDRPRVKSVGNVIYLVH